MKKLLNNYIQIEPLEYKGYLARVEDSYEEIGKVVAVDEKLADAIPLGALCYFDSFMAKKYPNSDGKGYSWYVNFEEIVKIETDDATPVQE